MATAIRITLHNIPQHLEPGDEIECTINGDPFPCTFVRYGVTERFLWAKIKGMREVANGRLSFLAQLDLFGESEPLEFVTEFIVNDAPGRPWHRTAGMSAECES